jgi:hypothetical protein
MHLWRFYGLLRENRHRENFLPFIFLQNVFNFLLICCLFKNSKNIEKCDFNRESSLTSRGSFSDARILVYNFLFRDINSHKAIKCCFDSQILPVVAASSHAA